MGRFRFRSLGLTTSSVLEELLVDYIVPIFGMFEDFLSIKELLYNLFNIIPRRCISGTVHIVINARYGELVSKLVNRSQDNFRKFTDGYLSQF